jgi:hypothetical protein
MKMNDDIFFVIIQINYAANIFGLRERIALYNRA